ncbi:MAG: efflux RND transporter periplasmic adaptor subunit, partial [Proteobacteria bacterium]|nr:efflux RND transporter periplasmic adaptor subunit [Pseudomonadota bacterium]
MDRRIEQKSRRPLIIGGATGAAVLLLIIFFATFDASTSFTLDGQRIRTSQVATGVYEDFIPLRAAVEPERTVYLDAVDGGRVEDILVEEGSFVEEGQPLIDLSNTSLQPAVIAREAEV